jgi:hypothetical protein
VNSLVANGANPHLANQDFATVVSSDQPVLAERSMYFGPRWAGGTTSAGARQPAGVWYFAEGAAAPKFDTFLTVLNPNDYPVSYSVSYLGDRGVIATKSYGPVAARSRDTIWVTGQLGHVGGVGARIASQNGEPIICERSTYWGAHWVEGSNAVGVNDVATVWELPEGITRSGFDTFILVANPHPFPVRIRVTPILENGAVINIHDVDMPAMSRETFWMNVDSRFPSVWNSTFSVKVEALTGPGVIAEQAIYRQRDPENNWRGGSAAFGIPHQKQATRREP